MVDALGSTDGAARTAAADALAQGLVLGTYRFGAYKAAPEGPRPEAITVVGKGGKRTAEANTVELLGQIPIEPAIMTGGDTGTPQVAAAPDSETGQAFHHLAERVAIQLASQSIAKPRKPTIMLRSV